MKFKDYLEETLNQRQLRLGKKVEKEHLEDPQIRNILKDQLNKIRGSINTKTEKKAEGKALTALVTPHLREIPNYYKFLIPMEKKAKTNLAKK